MTFRKRSDQALAFRLQTDDGKKMPLKLKFKNGEIHINASQMPRGTYQLTMDRGDDVESQYFKVE